ncbi:MAG: branched-chain amino acid ABC transporter permease [Dehalococcoidia bacterium]|nr:branched-chain amino acid ABC transporter permease [Dehalococcoidia bacterium]MDH4367097.1 branched-chain amino acid ABC transporter permease [Dehalococcoidia bacterium]
MKIPRLTTLASLAVLVVLALFPVIGIPLSWLNYLFTFFICLALANMWNLLAGYTGLICLCPHAFVGLAGYTLAIGSWVGVPFQAGLIAGAAVAALFALLISFPVFRMRGIYFAIGTLILPEALKAWFNYWRPVGNVYQGMGAGYSVTGVEGVTLGDTFWLGLAIAAASIFLVHIILRARLGLGLTAIRDNENTAASAGVNVFRLKLYSFLIAAFIMGIAGAAYYIYSPRINPVGGFNISWLLLPLMATVIGGEGLEEGPIIGAAIVTFLRFLLADYGAWSLFIQGIILLVVVVVMPQGIAGLLRQVGAYRFPLRLFQAVEGRIHENVK